MLISNKKSDVSVAFSALNEAIESSRFKANLHCGKKGINITQVRLKKSKDYCGNHPGPCLVQEQTHRHHIFLEGLDWIAFNWLVNNVLDRFSLDANVTSGALADTRTFYVRKGTSRRMFYEYTYIGDDDRPIPVWINGNEDYFSNYCGKKPPRLSMKDYPHLLGTPGLLTIK